LADQFSSIGLFLFKGNGDLSVEVFLQPSSDTQRHPDVKTINRENH